MPSPPIKTDHGCREPFRRMSDTGAVFRTTHWSRTTFLSTSLLNSLWACCHCGCISVSPTVHAESISAMELYLPSSHISTSKNVLSHVNTTGHPHNLPFYDIPTSYSSVCSTWVSLCSIKLLLEMRVFMFLLLNHSYWSSIHPALPWAVMNGYLAHTEAERALSWLNSLWTNWWKF